MLRAWGSSMKLTEPGQTRPQKSEAHHSSIFGKELGQATRPVGTVVRHKRRTPRDDQFLSLRSKNVSLEA